MYNEKDRERINAEKSREIDLAVEREIEKAFGNSDESDFGPADGPHTGSDAAKHEGNDGSGKAENGSRQFFDIESTEGGLPGINTDTDKGRIRNEVGDDEFANDSFAGGELTDGGTGVMHGGEYEGSDESEGGITYVGDDEDDYNISSFKFEEEGDSETKKNAKGKDKKKNGKKGKRGKGAKVAKIALSIFLVLVITVCASLGGILIYLFNFMDNSISENLDDLKLNMTTAVYVKDDSGNWVEYQRIHGVENRIWVSLDKIPVQMQHAVIAIEDERFDTHSGVDWKRTTYAVLNEMFHLSSRRQGGSTITQQLVKNLTGDKKQNAGRKIREILRALELEKLYSKDTILECYLNTIPLGGSCYGVEVAAGYYFGKSVSELSIKECATIAAITQNPTKYRPDKEEGLVENGKRATTVIEKMLELGFITKEEHDAALAEEVKIVADKEVLKEKEINSYFVDTMIVQVAEDLAKEYRYEYSEALKKVYNGGYKIYSTLNPKIQAVIEGEAQSDRWKIASKTTKNTYAEVGITIMDYQGNIVASVGGRGKKEGNMLLDHAYAVPNQPGSAMKSIGAYALAVDENLINYSTMIEDSPLAKQDGRDWPVNWYSGYTGNQTVAHAIAQSINTIPCKLVKQLSTAKSYEFVTKKLGLSHLNPGPDKDESISALAIGGTNGGVTPVELAGAYAIFGNGGKFYTPKTYTRVTDRNGNDLLKVSEDDYVQAISEDSAYVMNRLLKNAVFGRDATSWMFGAATGSELFAKSGTSSDYYDNWLVGGSPYYVGAVWVGFDIQEECPTNNAKYILTDIFREIHKGLEVKSFQGSDNVVSAVYCEATGLLASGNCPSVNTGYYKKDAMPGTCTYHKGGGSHSDTSSGTSSEGGDTSSETPSENPDDGGETTPQD